MKKKTRNNLFWEYFYELCSIKRTSGKESLVRNYLIRFAKVNFLHYYSDNAGNLVVVKQFDKYENLILQAHMDMVFVKESSEVQNFVVPERHGNFINSIDTSLGADNGIGIAYILALLGDKELDSKYNLICIFTVEEETTMNGARLFSQQLFSRNMSKFGVTGPFEKLLSFDGFSQDNLIIGTSGAKAWKIAAPLELKDRRCEKTTMVKITLDNFLGGHSGNDILLNPDNPIKICSDIFTSIINEFTGVRLHKITVNPDAKVNAIARKCEIIFSFESSKKVVLQRIQHLLSQHFIGNISGRYEVEVVDNELTKCLSSADSKKVASLLCKIPHGAIYKKDETVLLSVNLAKVEVSNARLRLVLSARGFKKYLNEIERTFMKFDNFTFEKTLDIPSSEPMVSTGHLIEELEPIYERIFSSFPNRVFANFCTELGYFINIFPMTEFVIISPNIFNAHSPSESLQIDSAEKIFKVINCYIQRIY